MLNHRPKFFYRFLKWFCHPELIEDIEGDLNELFERKASGKGIRRAKWSYVIEVVRLFRPGIIRPVEGTYHLNQYGMLKNYLKIAYRSILKRKLISAISIIGFAVAIACSIAVFLYAHQELKVGSFHTNGGRVFVTQTLINRDGERKLWSDGPSPIGPALLHDVPLINRMARIFQWRTRSTIKHRDKVFEESITFADKDLLNILKYDLEGNRDVLASANQIAINRHLSTRYFGEDANPVGQELTFIFPTGERMIFTVGAVFEIDKSSQFYFQCLVPFEIQNRVKEFKADHNDWSTFTSGTFIELDNSNDIHVVSTHAQRYIKQHGADEWEWPAEKFLFESINDIPKNKNNVLGRYYRTIQYYDLYIAIALAIAILVIASLNYLNIAITSGAYRLKEIGVRKTLGGSKGALVQQFLVEHIVICFLAAILGLLLCEAVILPFFRETFDAPVYLNSGGLNIWIFSMGFTLITALLSGAYPAYYISQFNAVLILKGKQTISSRKSLRRMLLVSQFVISMVAIIWSISFIKNVDYYTNLDWGYNQSNVIQINLDNSQTYALLKSQAVGNPDIVSSAGTTETSLMHGGGLRFVKVEGKEYEIIGLEVGKNYLEMMELKLNSGKFATASNEIVINEKFRKNMGWQSAIGKRIHVYNEPYTVVGEIEDLRVWSFNRRPEPVFFRAFEEDQLNTLVVRCAPGTLPRVSEFLEEEYKALVQDRPYKQYFQDESMKYYFDNLKRISSLFNFSAILILSLASIGLFGSVSLVVVQRMKDICIRKVLGGTFKDISRVLGTEYFKILFSSLVIGLPLSYLVTDRLIKDWWSDHPPIGMLPYVMASVSILVVLGLILFPLIWKAIRTNPVEYLKEE